MHNDFLLQLDRFKLMLKNNSNLIEIKYQWYWPFVSFIAMALSYSLLFFQYIYSGKLIQGEDTSSIEIFLFNLIVICFFTFLPPLCIYHFTLHILVFDNYIQVSRFYGKSKYEFSLQHATEISIKKYPSGKIYLIKVSLPNRKSFQVDYFASGFKDFTRFLVSKNLANL